MDPKASKGERPSTGKAWRTIAIAAVAMLTAPCAAGLKSDLPNLPPWVRLVDASLFLLAGLLFLAAGFGAIRWRKQLAELQSTFPGVRWHLGQDPMPRLRFEAVCWGLIALVIGSVLLLFGTDLVWQAMIG